MEPDINLSTFNLFSSIISVNALLFFLLLLLQPEATQGLPVSQASCFLPPGLHLGSGPQAVGQHPLPAVPGPEDRVFLPEDWRRPAKRLPPAAAAHLHSGGEGRLHAAFSPRVNKNRQTKRTLMSPELLIQDVTAALSGHRLCLRPRSVRSPSHPPADVSVTDSRALL